MNRNEFLKLSVFGAASFTAIPSLLAKTLFQSNPYDEALCKKVWQKLCGKLADKDYMAYVGPQEGLKNVLIYGDSISQHYTNELRTALKGKATVFRLFKNGGDSSKIVPFVDRMQKTMFEPHLKGGWDFKWDLIQFNVGLHDLKYVTKDRKYDVATGVQVTSLDQYKKNLEKAIAYFKKKHPKAQLIYALTTPVPEGSSGRKQGDAANYNKAALEVLKNYPGIVVNDLHSFTLPHMEAWMKSPGNVHYNDAGQQAQAKEVARVIAKTLKL